MFMRKNIVKGYIYAILSAVIYGCMPLMAKYIYADGLNPMMLSFLRNFLALPVLAAFAYKTNRTLKVPAALLPFITLLSVLGCSITPILLFSSYQFIASGTATVFHFVYPAVVVLLGILFLKKKTRIWNMISVLLCVIGICLFYTPGQPLNLVGSILALGSGIAFAAYVVLLSVFPNQKISGFLFTFYIAAVSSIVTFLICIAIDAWILPASLIGWGLSALFALLVSAGAVVLFQTSAFLIGSERTSILSTLEPVTSIVVGAVLLHEPIGGRVFLGSLLVISASILIAVVDLRKKKISEIEKS